MPELPEVETVRRVLAERLLGKTLTAYALGKPTFYRKPPETEITRLIGRKLEEIQRKGKYLQLRFNGEAELVLHLGMSGSIRLGEPTPHERLRLDFEGEFLRINDPRRFGRAACKLPTLGPEPLEESFNAVVLAEKLRGRKAPIKALLLDQRIVAGLGNIYATEALFEARIRPGRAAGVLRRNEIGRLTEAIRSILTRAVEAGGSTLDDQAYVDPLGRPGRAQDSIKVYGRETGACGHALKATRRIIGGRRALYCPECQL